MLDNKKCFVKTKVIGNTIVEVYRYNISQTKDAFFKHYKEMQARHFKNDRSKDETKDNWLYVTYIKNIPVTVINQEKNKRKERMA